VPPRGMNTPERTYGRNERAPDPCTWLPCGVEETPERGYAMPCGIDAAGPPCCRFVCPEVPHVKYYSGHMVYAGHM